MATYQDFIDSLLPGNYALTKSMELTKIQTSGTLWYTKKFLVLYYYVFLSNEIFTKEYIHKVVDIFDTYINTLDDSVKEDAKIFFYPENETMNFKSHSFKTFSSFAGQTEFLSQEERRTYIQKAKKCYFALLMNSGGQTGVKKFLKESLQSKDFCYSETSIAEILYTSAINSLTIDVNKEHKIKDNSIKYILSEKTMQQAVSLSLTGTVTTKEIEKLARQYPNPNPHYGSIENDMVAFIRNERQILYYYGYFHSKSSGANDLEFSSLTPIGELALTANAIEFLAIWEHQKIKMISQPETVIINKLSICQNNPERFAISFSPYTDILEHLMKKGSLSLEEYKLVIGRKNRRINKDWNDIESEIFTHLDDIKQTVYGFQRRGR